MQLSFKGYLIMSYLDPVFYLIIIHFLLQESFQFHEHFFFIPVLHLFFLHYKLQIIGGL